MARVGKRSFLSALLQSITFQLLLFVAIVFAYNRVVYKVGSVSGRSDFSAWAAPLYAMVQPIPQRMSAEVLTRWLVPLLIASIWIGLSLRRIKRSGAAIAGEAIPPGFWACVRSAVGLILAFNISVAMMDSGIKSITWPFSMSGEEYFGDAGKTKNPIQLFHDYPKLIAGHALSRHASTHPPGGVMFLWGVRKLIGDGLMPASLAAIVMTALTIVPAGLLARRMLSASALMIFFGIYLLTPNLVLFGATSMDGVFAFFLVMCVWFFFGTATCEARPAHFTLRSINVGFWLAASIFFTYASIGLVAVMVVWTLLEFLQDRAIALRACKILAIASGTMAGCFLILHVLTGCNIIACARASIAFDAEMMRGARGQYWDVSVTNLLGFLVGSGFLVSVLFLRNARTWRLKLPRRGGAGQVSAALVVTIVVLSFSTLFTRELERVWIFLTPLLLIGAADELDRLTPENSRKRWIVAALILLLAQTWVSQILLYTLW